jgi:hypothetical protein
MTSIVVPDPRVNKFQRVPPGAAGRGLSFKVHLLSYLARGLANQGHQAFCTTRAKSSVSRLGAAASRRVTPLLPGRCPPMDGGRASLARGVAVGAGFYQRGGPGPDVESRARSLAENPASTGAREARPFLQLLEALIRADEDRCRVTGGRVGQVRPLRVEHHAGGGRREARAIRGRERTRYS